jgi:hypothetical protein
MPSESAILIALPNGFAPSGQARLSILLVPQLEPDEAEGTLANFAFANWPARLRDSTFEVHAGNSTADATQTSVLADAAWTALFPPDVLVRPIARQQPLGALGSYPAGRIHDSVRRMHESAVPRTNPEVVPRPAPATDLTDSVANLRLRGEQAELAMNLLTPTPQNEMNTSARRLVELAREQALGSRAGGASDFVPIVPDTGNVADAWAQFAFFHMQRALTRELLEAPAPLPRLDFEQRVALLSDYPELLRKLGLIVDLTFDAALLSASEGEVEVRLKRAPDIAFQRAQPRTRYHTSAGRFEAAAKGSEIVNGVLNLADHEVIGFDLDGAGLQILAGLRDANREKKPPSLRSTGLSLVRAKRAQQMHRSIAEVFASMQQLESGASPVLFAEDLVRGYRVDIFETRSGRWRSLHQRIGTYTFTSTGAQDRIGDEGAVMPNIAQPERSDRAIAEATHDPEQPGFVAESVFVWNGWSLSAARPVVAMTELTLPQPASPAASVPLTVTFEAEPRSLPRLRFGDSYRVRLRIADLAGNGVPAPTDADPGPTGPEIVLPLNDEAWRFLRCEPVGPPVVQRPGDEDPDAASIDSLVLKSGHEDSAMVTAAAEVQITPPLVSQLMAEQMGAFDQSIGTSNNLDRTFGIAAGEAPGADARIHRDKPNGALPDPMAIGIAIHNCPGIAEGQLATFDSAGVLQLSSLAVPETMRGGVSSVLLIPFVGAPEWPSIDGLLLRLRDGDGQPEWDPGQRILTVFLQPAMEREIQVACNLDDAGLDRMTILKWASERLDERVKAGQLSAEAARNEISALRRAGNAGVFEMITPVHKMRLIHAVREPLLDPEMVNFAPLFRFPGDTKVFLSCDAVFDQASTSRLELRASWEDRDDSPALPALTLTTRTASILTVDLAAPANDQPAGVIVDLERGVLTLERHPIPQLEADIQEQIAKVLDAQSRLRDAGAPDDLASDVTLLVSASPRPLQPHWAELRDLCESVALVAKQHMFDATAPEDAPFNIEATDVHTEVLALSSMISAAIFHTTEPHFSHDPGDPKHRNFTYQWHAVSRFAAHYGSNSDDPELRFVKLGSPISASVRSSARPAPPKIIRVVPSFQWVRETSPAGIRIHERRAGLRVYLERPWFSSGDGELLAVVVGFGLPAPPSFQPGTFTRWARDPAWVTGGLPADPRVDHFRNFALRIENDTRPILLGYEVQHDSHGRCFCDIDMELPGSYSPFVKLALARLQPKSIEGLALSEIVIADPAPLLPRRRIIATPQSDGSLVVEISGATHRSVRPLEDATGTVFGAVLQRQFAPGSGDLGWEEADDVGSIKVEETPSAEFLWRATVRIDTPEPNLRLLIGEAEIFSSPDLLDPSAAPRGVFAETIPL